jgi:hypothetical protein
LSRQRKEPITDSWILAAVQRGGGLGNYDDEGHYGTLVINLLANRREAQEYKSSLYRCAHYLARTGQAPVSISMADIEKSGLLGEYKLTFQVSDKERAREYIRREFGENPSNWPYDPRNGSDRDHYRGG